jgi:hypothetical protein
MGTKGANPDTQVGPILAQFDQYLLQKVIFFKIGMITPPVVIHQSKAACV